MADKQLYANVIESGGITRTGSDGSRRTDAQGALSGQATVNPLSLEPGQQQIEGTILGFNAEVLAMQVEQLANAGDIPYVPYTEPDRDNQGADPGYYVVENASKEPIEEQQRAAYNITVALSHEGTKKSHYRALVTAPASVRGAVTDDANGDPYPIPDPDEQVTVALDRRATKVRWYNPITKRVEDAEPIYETVMGEQAVCEHYLLDDPSWYSLADADTDTPAPTLIYELDYAEEYQADARVWDTHGKPPDEKVISEDYGPAVGGPGVQVGDAQVGGHGLTVGPRYDEQFLRGQRVNATWQRVFSSDHDFAGATVLSNGILRLILDEQAGVMRCQRSRGHFDEWAEQPMRPSAWALHDVDVTHVGLARVAAQIAFRHGRTGTIYSLDVALPRGYERARWTIPTNESSGYPASLWDKLVPVATGGRHIDPNGRASLVPRSEVRL